MIAYVGPTAGCDVGTVVYVAAAVVGTFSAPVDWDSLPHGWVPMPDDADYSDPPQMRPQRREEARSRPP